MKTTIKRASFSPAVGTMQNGTHKHFRRIFCNNYPASFRRNMTEAIEGTPEERRERAFQERLLHFQAVNRLKDLKAQALSSCDFGEAMMYHNQIQDLQEKWERNYGDDLK